MTVDIYRDFNEALSSVFPPGVLMFAQAVIGLYLMAVYVPLRAWSPRFQIGSCQRDRCPADWVTLRMGQIGLALSAVWGLAMVIDALTPPDSVRGPTMFMALTYAMIQTRGAYIAWRAQWELWHIKPAPPYEVRAPMT